MATKSQSETPPPAKSSTKCPQMRTTASFGSCPAPEWVHWDVCSRRGGRFASLSCRCFVVVGRYVWAGTSTGPINIYDVRKRTLVKTARWVVFSRCWVLIRKTHSRVCDCITARHHAGGVHTLATGVDSERVFSGSNDFTCVMWSARGAFMKLYAGHSNGVRCTLGMCYVGLATPSLWLTPRCRQRWDPCCGREATTTPSVCGTPTSAPARPCCQATATLCWRCQLAPVAPPCGPRLVMARYAHHSRPHALLPRQQQYHRHDLTSLLACAVPSCTATPVGVDAPTHLLECRGRRPAGELPGSGWRHGACVHAYAAAAPCYWLVCCCCRRVSYMLLVVVWLLWGLQMWSCGAESIIRVWRTQDFTNIRALEGHTGYVLVAQLPVHQPDHALVVYVCCVCACVCVCVGGRFVGSLLQVRRVESHWLWSYGAGDKTLNIWRQDSRSSGSRDASELLAMAQAANRLYEVCTSRPWPHVDVVVAVWLWLHGCVRGCVFDGGVLHAHSR